MLRSSFLNFEVYPAKCYLLDKYEELSYFGMGARTDKNKLDIVCFCDLLYGDLTCGRQGNPVQMSVFRQPLWLHMLTEFQNNLNNRQYHT